jgi:Predicted nucleotide-binding protein containing TIR-like domain
MAVVDNKRQKDPWRSYSAYALTPIVEMMCDILAAYFSRNFVMESPPLNRIYLLLIKRARELSDPFIDIDEALSELLTWFPNLYEAITDEDVPDANWEFGGQAAVRKLRARIADAYVSHVETPEKMEPNDESLLSAAQELLTTYDSAKKRYWDRLMSSASASSPSGENKDSRAGGTDQVSVDPPLYKRGEPARHTTFVVHGRDVAKARALFAFRRAIGLHPLEWSEVVAATGKATPYVGEVLDAAFSIAQAVVVLLTADDEARLKESFWEPGEAEHETSLTGQARPNVLFEAGMAMGRFPERTVIVEIGQLRPFSDIAGRHTLRLNNTSQRRQELAHRLRDAGCPVNLDGTDWHNIGDFD